MRYIGLLDCNNFFVSCERVFRPDLETRPVLVMSSNDGCVVARSQEVKDMGIPMGVPVFQIKDIIKDKAITTFSSNFTLYRDFSRRVFATLSGLVPVMEQYSIDEAFFVLEAETVESAEAQLRDIRSEIIKVTGIPVSIGLSYTKTQAKYASKVAKKTGGVFVATTTWWKTTASEILLGDVWGVGRQFRERYAKSGIKTVFDLINAPSAMVQNIAGIGGRRLQDELAGISTDPVSKICSTPKSIMSSQSFSKDTTDQAVVLDALYYHLDQITSDLEKCSLVASALHILMRPSRFKSDQYFPVISYPCEIATRNRAVLRTVIKDVVVAHFQPGVRYKKAGVFVTGLLPDTLVTNSLFSATSETEIDVSEVLKIIHTRYGKTAMTQGGVYQNQWRARKEQHSPHYTTNWTDLPNVKT